MGATYTSGRVQTIKLVFEPTVDDHGNHWVTVWAAAETKNHGWVPFSVEDINPGDLDARAHQVIGGLAMETLKRSRDPSVLVVGDAGCVTYRTTEEALR